MGKHERFRERAIAEMADEYCKNLGMSWMLSARWIHARVPRLSGFIAMILRHYNRREPRRIIFDLTRLHRVLETVDKFVPEIHDHLSEGGGSAEIVIKLKFADGKESLECKPTVGLTLSQPDKVGLTPVPVYRENGTIKMEVTTQEVLPLRVVNS